MGTVNSSRRGKATAAKRPASAGARAVKSKGGAAKAPARATSGPTPPSATGKSNNLGAAAVPVREVAGKAVAAATPAPERSPPALPIPIASFTF